MHTFDNGLKDATRKDNWEQLFRRFGFGDGFRLVGVWVGNN